MHVNIIFILIKRSWFETHDFNMLRPVQNDHPIAYYVFKCMLLNENGYNLIEILLWFPSKCPNKPAKKVTNHYLNQWRRSLLLHMCVAQPEMIASHRSGLWSEWNVTNVAWLRDEMETFSALLALFKGNPPVTGGFPSERSVPQSFDVFFDLRWNDNSDNPFHKLGL